MCTGGEALSRDRLAPWRRAVHRVGVGVFGIEVAGGRTGDAWRTTSFILRTRRGAGIQLSGARGGLSGRTGPGASLGRPCQDGYGLTQSERSSDSLSNRPRLARTNVSRSSACGSDGVLGTGDTAARIWRPRVRARAKGMKWVRNRPKGSPCSCRRLVSTDSPRPATGPTKLTQIGSTPRTSVGLLLNEKGAVAFEFMAGAEP